MRERARKHKQERFTNLLRHVTPTLLKGSFYALKRNAAPGVHGMTWKEYETGLEERHALRSTSQQNPVSRHESVFIDLNRIPFRPAITGHPRVGKYRTSPPPMIARGD